jgi:hypothetical protein
LTHLAGKSRVWKVTRLKVTNNMSRVGYLGFEGQWFGYHGKLGQFT